MHTDPYCNKEVAYLAIAAMLLGPVIALIFIGICTLFGIPWVW